MKLLIDFCVSQLIALLSMTTADKFVFSTHIYSSRKFLFWSSNTSLTLIFFVGHLANLFVNPFTYSRYTRPCLPSTEPTMSPSPRQPRKHTKQRFDFVNCCLWIYKCKLNSSVKGWISKSMRMDTKGHRSLFFIMQVSIWPVTIPPGHPGAFAPKCLPSPGAFAQQKMPGAGPIKDDVPGAGHLYQLAFQTRTLLTQLSHSGLKN